MSFQNVGFRSEKNSYIIRSLYRYFYDDGAVSHCFMSPLLCDCTDCIRPIMRVRLLLHVLNKRLKIRDMMMVIILVIILLLNVLF